MRYDRIERLENASCDFSAAIRNSLHKWSSRIPFIMQTEINRACDRFDEIICEEAPPLEGPLKGREHQHRPFYYQRLTTVDGLEGTVFFCRKGDIVDFLPYAKYQGKSDFRESCHMYEFPELEVTMKDFYAIKDCVPPLKSLEVNNG